MLKSKIDYELADWLGLRLGYYKKIIKKKLKIIKKPLSISNGFEAKADHLNVLNDYWFASLIAFHSFNLVMPSLILISNVILVEFMFKLIKMLFSIFYSLVE